MLLTWHFKVPLELGFSGIRTSVLLAYLVVDFGPFEFADASGHRLNLTLLQGRSMDGIRPQIHNASHH